MADHSQCPALRVDSLSKSFGGATILDSISVFVAPGQAIILTGDNGAGKTTLFNILSGFLRPDRGEVRVMNRALRFGSPHRVARLGLRRTFQEVRVFPKLTVLDNVLMGGIGGSETAISGILRGRKFREREEELRVLAIKSLEFTSMADRAMDLAGDLSFGQQKLVEIARALAGSPEVLLLDEPVAGVHKALARDIAGVLAELKKSGKTLLIIEHELDLISGLADAVLELSLGHINTRKIGELPCG